MSQQNLFCCIRRNLLQCCSSLVNCVNLLPSFNNTPYISKKTLQIRDQFFLYMDPVHASQIVGGFIKDEQYKSGPGGGPSM